MVRSPFYGAYALFIVLCTFAVNEQTAHTGSHLMQIHFEHLPSKLYIYIYIRNMYIYTHHIHIRR